MEPTASAVSPGADDLMETAGRLAAILGRGDAAGVQPVLLERGAAPVRLVAVDGSSVVVLESGRMLVGAFRAARVTLARGVATSAPGPLHTALLLPGRTLDLLQERSARLGLPPVERSDSKPLEPTACLHALRGQVEAAAARDALDSLSAGDMLLLDGPLRSRPPDDHAGRLAREARSRGVDVVGVSKATSLTAGGMPAIAACLMAAAPLGGKPWAAALSAPADVAGSVFIARLSAAEPRPFRFDVHAADGDAMRVLGALAAVSGHPATPGYPSALGMAHAAAVITEDTRRTLRARLEAAAVDAGASPQAMDAVFRDYHEVLEMGV